MENIRFHITVKGIVVFKQKVLLMKRVRPSSDGLGYWELPGGGLEYGETPNESLKRELKEETGLTIDVASTDDDHVSISFEHTDYKWCPIDELKDYLCDEIYQDIIYTLKEYTSI